MQKVCKNCTKHTVYYDDGYHDGCSCSKDHNEHDDCCGVLADCECPYFEG